MDKKATKKLDIGFNLKRLREMKGYKPEYIAEHINVAPRTYLDYENNIHDVGVNKLVSIAEVLEVSLWDIITFDNKNFWQNNFHNESESKATYTVNNNPPSNKERELYEKIIANLEATIALMKNK